MHPTGIVIIGGVAIAAIVVIGTAIYEAYRDSSQNYNKHEERPKHRTSKWTSSEQKEPVCCELPLAGKYIRRLPCKHVFHDACVLGAMLTLGVDVLMAAPPSKEAEPKVHKVGAITELAPADKLDVSDWTFGETADVCSASPQVHTWSTTVEDRIKLRLDTSKVSGVFVVTLFYSGMVLDRAKTDRLDAEPLQSVIFDSTVGDTHIVTWLMADKTCKRRTYREKRITKGMEKARTVVEKTENSCTPPPDAGRWNFWKWENTMAFSQRAIVKGAILTFTTTAGAGSPYCGDNTLLYTWKYFIASVNDYELRLHRFEENHEVRLYIELRYAHMTLDSGHQVSRFDDEMLASVRIADEPTKPLRGFIYHQVEYYTTEGECIRRVYEVFDSAVVRYGAHSCLHPLRDSHSVRLNQKQWIKG